jgi:hypothetical protein
MKKVLRDLLDLRRGNAGLKRDGMCSADMLQGFECCTCTLRWKCMGTKVSLRMI